MVYDPPIPSFGCGHNNCASPHLNFTPPLAVTDDGHQQIYRMYHIYNRNLFVCVIPSIASVGLFGESVFTRVLLLSLNCDFVAAGCGIAHQFRDPTAPSFPQAVSRWTACSFSLSVLQVPPYLVGLLEMMLTREFQ